MHWVDCWKERRHRTAPVRRSKIPVKLAQELHDSKSRRQGRQENPLGEEGRDAQADNRNDSMPVPVPGYCRGNRLAPLQATPHSVIALSAVTSRPPRSTRMPEL